MTVPTAAVLVDLSDHTGHDSIPWASWRTLTFDPLVDRVWPDGTVTVAPVTVELDRDTGRATHANGRTVPGGVVTLVAGVTYQLTGLAQDHTVGPLPASTTPVPLGELIVPGTPLTPSAESLLAQRLDALEATPPGAYDDTNLRADIAAGDAATLIAAQAYADTRPGPQGEQGPVGPAGAKGETGDIGPQGPAGPKGDPGAASTVPGPKGDKGDPGDTGPPGTTSWAGITDKPATYPPAGIPAPSTDGKLLGVESGVYALVDPPSSSSGTGAQYGGPCAPGRWYNSVSGGGVVSWLNSDGWARWAPFWNAAPITIDAMAVSVTNSSSGATMQIAIYTYDGSGLTRLTGPWTADLGSNGIKQATLASPSPLPAGVLWLGWVSTGTGLSVTGSTPPTVGMFPSLNPDWTPGTPGDLLAGPHTLAPTITSLIYARKATWGYPQVSLRSAT